jgi:hypothetical protein
MTLINKGWKAYITNDSSNPLPVSGTVTLPSLQLRPDGSYTQSVEPLSVPGVARVITVSTGNTNTALTSGITRISIRAAGTNTFYTVGSGSQTATLSGHFIANGERLDIGVPPSAPNIAVICASGSSGVLYVSELN